MLQSDSVGRKALSRCEMLWLALPSKGYTFTVCLTPTPVGPELGDQGEEGTGHPGPLLVPGERVTHMSFSGLHTLGCFPYTVTHGTISPLARLALRILPLATSQEFRVPCWHFRLCHTPPVDHVPWILFLPQPQGLVISSFILPGIPMSLPY